MPLLAEADPPRKRRVPMWALLAVVLPLAAVLAWSFFQPVVIRLHNHEVGFGYGRPAVIHYLARFDYDTPDEMIEHGRFAVPLYLGDGYGYIVWWF